MKKPTAVQTWVDSDDSRYVLLSDGSIWTWAYESSTWVIAFDAIPACVVVDLERRLSALEQAHSERNYP